MEALIGASIFALLLTITLGVLITTQQSVTSGSANQLVTSQSRQLAERISRELRDLNLTTDDLEPDAPFESTSLQYRLLVGYDPAIPEAQLEPTRSSGLFRRISYSASDRSVTLETPGLNVVLGKRVSDLRFTLDPPDKLVIKVSVEQQDHQGQLIRGSSEVTVGLRNKVSAAN